MVQIISNESKQSNFTNWITEVLNDISDKGWDIQQALLMIPATTDDGEIFHLMEFMNLGVDDIYYMGAILQKEAIKEDMRIELGLTADYGEYDEEYEESEDIIDEDE